MRKYEEKTLYKGVTSLQEFSLKSSSPSPFDASKCNLLKFYKKLNLNLNNYEQKTWKIYQNYIDLYKIPRLYQNNKQSHIDLTYSSHTDLT